jgi:hypothetical protein
MRCKLNIRFHDASIKGKSIRCEADNSNTGFISVRLLSYKGMTFRAAKSIYTIYIPSCPPLQEQENHQGSGVTLYRIRRRMKTHHESRY